MTFPGHDLLPWAGEFDSIVDEIEEFVTGGRGAHAPTRLLATVLFTDIVDSTVHAAEVGDRQWRAVLDEFDVNVERLLSRHDGVLVKNTGDGILARFVVAGAGGALRGWRWWTSRGNFGHGAAGRSARRRGGAARRRHRRAGRPHRLAGQRPGRSRTRSS